jgi:cyclically-permuted mutarotase family protein
LSDEATLEWNQVGLLPEASAYGVTVSTGDRLICAGGNTAERSLSDVFQLSLKEGMVQMDTLPSLPVTIDNMAGAMLDNTLYIVGGNVNGVPSSNVYSLNLDNLAEGWKEEVSVPGNPRVQPVCAAQGGKLYVWGGFSTAGEGREATLSVDGYAYTPSAKEWKQVATPTDETGTPVSLGGGVALPLGTDAVLCAGGLNKDIFLQALQGIHKGKEYLTRPVEWYQFNRKLLKYDTKADKWTVLGDFEQGARAGAALVSDGSSYYIINGELKPGIRTKDINRIKMK